MPILCASDMHLRSRVIDYLKEMKKHRPEATVLDVGGAMNPWCDEYVTTYIDIQEIPTTREVLIGDITNNTF